MSWDSGPVRGHLDRTSPAVNGTHASINKGTVNTWYVNSEPTSSRRSRSPVRRKNPEYTPASSLYELFYAYAERESDEDVIVGIRHAGLTKLLQDLQLMEGIPRAYQAHHVQEVLWRSSSDKDGTMSVYEFFAWLFFDLFALLPVAANGALHPRRAWQWTGCRCHGSRANDEDRGPILVNAHASVLVDSLAPRRAVPVYNRFVTGCLTALEYPYPAASRAASASAREAAQYRHLLRGETKRDVASGMTLWQLRVLCRVLDLTLDDSLLKRIVEKVTDEMAKSRAARGRVNGKEESGQKLQLRQFLQALEMIASATGVSTDQLLCKVVVYDKISTIPEPNNSMSPEEWEAILRRVEFNFLNVDFAGPLSPDPDAYQCDKCGREHTRWELHPNSLQSPEFGQLAGWLSRRPGRGSINWMRYTHARNLRAVFYRFNARYGKGLLLPAGPMGEGLTAAVCSCQFRSLSSMDYGTWWRLMGRVPTVLEALQSNADGNRFTPARLKHCFMNTSTVGGMHGPPIHTLPAGGGLGGEDQLDALQAILEQLEAEDAAARASASAGITAYDSPQPGPSGAGEASRPLHLSAYPPDHPGRMAARNMSFDSAGLGPNDADAAGQEDAATLIRRSALPGASSPGSPSGSERSTPSAPGTARRSSPVGSPLGLPGSLVAELRARPHRQAGRTLSFPQFLESLRQVAEEIVGHPQSIDAVDVVLLNICAEIVMDVSCPYE